MGIITRLFNPSLVSNCTKYLIEVSPKSEPSAKSFCNTFASELYENKSEGFSDEGCLNLLCMNLLSIPSLADKTNFGAFGLVIASDYAMAYSIRYPDAGATRPLLESLDDYIKTTRNQKVA